MKLLLCGHCGDIVKLHPELRTCLCGKSWGGYLPDNSTTVQTNHSVSLGIANPDFQRALQVFGQDRESFTIELSMRAWINPDSEPDVVYVNEEMTIEQARAAHQAADESRDEVAADAP